ncbi:unnamed protein product [Gulo gulo]|uniref:Uncharacterized protein n=1 Tax=Gulo gulo TaxID=48420 RepID=A0A9X9LXY5_GULGU|nr:unnamed protein product [Gulo gulo]
MLPLRGGGGWCGSDAVSLRTHEQLSCHKDNCLSGQHYTRLSASGHPHRQEGAAEVLMRIEIKDLGENKQG